MTFQFRAYGLGIAADRDLPGLLRGDGQADVTIVQGDVPAALEVVEASRPRWTANARELLLAVPDVGRFHIRDGRAIIYQPACDAQPSSLESYLLGSCMGAVLHQRGKLVLHASAVASSGRAYAICGKSGLGKSTIAGHLVAQGAAFLSDDLAVFDETGAMVQPGYPQAKLTTEALKRLAIGEEGLRRLPGERNKRAVPRTRQFCQKAAPIGGLFILEQTSAVKPSVERIAPGLVSQYLLRHTYRRRYVVPRHEQRYFAMCTALAYLVPAWCVFRPSSGDSTASLVSAICEAIEQQVGSSLEVSN